MALHNQIVVDPRLCYDSATQLIEIGAQQVSQRKIPATVVNPTTVSFQNILSIGKNIVIDPYMQVVYKLRITRTTAASLSTPPGLINLGASWALAPVGRPIADANTTTTNNANMCFTQYPLSQACNSLSLSINNVETNVPLGVLMAVMRENIVPESVRDGLLSSTPSTNNRQPVLFDQNLSVPGSYYVTEQPNTPNALCSGLNRLNYSSLDLTGAGLIAEYTLIEPVFISPLSVGASNHALCNVNSISLRWNLDASNGLKNMFNCTDTVLAADTDTLAITLFAADLYMNSLTVDPIRDPVPAVVFYDWNSYEVNTTAVGANPVAAVSKALNAYKLTTIFKMYMLKICPQVSSVNMRNLLCGAVIKDLVMTYGSYGQFTFNQQQLYLMYRRNTGSTGVSFTQWKALGTPVYISPLDLTSSGSFAGESGLGGIMVNTQVSYDFSNYEQAGTNYARAYITDIIAYEIYSMAGSCAVGQGISVFKNSTISMSEFDAEVDKSRILSKNVVEASQPEGGRFNFSGFKSVLSAGAKHLGKLAVQHGPELAKEAAKMGLEHLNNKLNEGGAMGVSGGRYSRRH